MENYILAAIFFAVAYLIGCFNLAYILGKRRNMDIRKKGSGNPGASNAMTTMGWGAGVAVGAADIFKAAIPIFAVRMIFADAQIIWIAVAVGCIIGHMYPVTLGFRGGKGLACLVGVYFALNPLACLIAALLIVIITLVTDYIALATILLAIAFPVFTYFTSGEYAIVAACLASVVAACMVIKHIGNIKRMLNGTEIGLRKASSGKYRSNGEK